MAGDFTSTSTCPMSPQTLASGSSCGVTVRFAPTSVNGGNGMLTITSNAANSPLALPLSGVPTDFRIEPAAGSPTSATIAAGQSASYSLTLSAVNGFTGTVDVACSGVPTAATCDISQRSVQLGGPANVTITVRTTARAAVPSAPPTRTPPLDGVRPVAFFLLVLMRC